MGTTSKRFRRKPRQPEGYSIARALDAFEPAEEARLCGFLQTMEERRIAGALSCWEIMRGPLGVVLTVTVDGLTFSGAAATISDAITDLSGKLVAEGMKGAAQA